MVCVGNGLVRARLIAELGGTSEDGRPRRLTIVVAPAGCGKTTLLAHHAASFAGPVAWLRLERSDAAPPELLRRLGAALAPLLPEPRPGIDRDADALRDASQALPPGCLLVVDDLHVLYGSPGENHIERFLADAPIQTILASRRMPGMNLNRYELGEVRLLDQEALRFRTWEVERLFRDVYAEPLLPEDVATLTRRLGGWAAGLHMFHLSTHGRSSGERGAAVRALDGRSPQSQAYLARTVLADLPEGVRDFLVRTCVFSVLTAERCDLLLGTDDARHHLRQLAARQAFTVSPDHGRTFRYHEALRAHLEVELVDDLGEQGARDWYGRAAAMLEAEGAYDDAAQAYARAANWPAVRRLIPSAAIGEGGELWHDLLPGWLVAEEPLLLLAQGRYLFSHGCVEHAVRAFRQAERRAHHPSARAAGQRARALASIWLPHAPPGTHQHWSAQLRAATRTCHGEVTGSRPVVVLVAQLLAGDLPAAHRLAASADPAGTDLDSLALRLARGALAAASGEAEAPVELERLADDAERARVPWLSRMARAALVLGGGERERKEARRIAEECERDGDLWGALLAGSAGCVAGTLRGEPDSDDIDLVVRLAQALGADVFVAWAMAARALLPGEEAGERVRQAEAHARAVGIPSARLPAALAWRRNGSAGSSSDLREDGPIARCFGGFSVEIDGGHLDLSAVRPKARMVLRLLALNAGRPVHREALLAALWPDMEPAVATRSLHVALSALRTLFAGHSLAQVVTRTGDAYLLDMRCDVADFRRALRGPRTADALAVAVAAYGGDLLPEDGAAEWVVREREVLRAQAVDCAGTLAMLHLEGGRPGEAVHAAARCLEIDGWHDPAWRTLITAYDRLGDVMAAARIRRRYAAMLDSLGVPHTS